MAKISYRLIVGLFLLLSITAFGDERFDHACVECHSTNIPDLQTLYFRYLQKHGSTSRSFAVMRHYLQNPTIEGSTLPPQVLKSFGLHPPLEPALLDEMLPLYFERYDVKKRLKFK